MEAAASRSNDIIARLDIRRRRGDKVDIACPCCQKTDRDPSRSTITLRPDGSIKWYNCFHCGAHLKELRQALGGHTPRLRYSPPPAETKTVRRDPEDVDRVFRHTLQACPLSPKHRQALHDRGLSDDQIRRHGYKTLRNGRPQIAAKVVEQLGSEALQGVPGFYINKAGKGGDYWDIAGASGLLVPVRDRSVFIVGAQIRRDGDPDGGKYRWLSSPGKKAGTSSGAPVHVARPATKKDGPTWIVEGPIKANITADYLQTNVIAVPGVSIRRGVIEHLDGATEAVVAYDSDFRTNANVKRELVALAESLDDAGVAVQVAVWDPEAGKGIDDVLTAGGTYELVDLDTFLGQHTGQQKRRRPRLISRAGTATVPTATDREPFRKELMTERLPVVDSSTPVAALDASPVGSGKSFATARALQILEAGGEVVPTLTLTTTHANCDSAVDIYNQHDLVAQKLPDRSDDKNCYWPDHVEGAQSLGLRATLIVCYTCPNHQKGYIRQFGDNKTCPYWAEIYFAEQAPHVVATYARLQDPQFLTRTAYWKDRHGQKHRRRIILDEAPLEHLRPTNRITARQADALKELFETIRDELDQHQSYGTEVGLFRRLRDLADMCTRAISDARQEKHHTPTPWQIPNELGTTTVRGKGVDLTDRRAVQNEILNHSRKDRTIHDQIETVLGEGIIDTLIDCLDAESTRWQAYLGGTRIVFRAEVELPTDTNIIVQDATADIDVIRTLLKRDVTDITPAGRLEDTGKLHQILNHSFSLQALATPRGFNLALAHIQKLMAEYDGAVGLISYKDEVHRLRDALPPDEQARISDDHIGWFRHQTRGVNTFQDCDLLIVIGTPRPGPAAYWEWLIRVHGDDVTNIKPAKGEMIRRRVEADGGLIEVASWGFRDPEWKRAYDQIVVAELSQAAGRGRHHDVNGPTTYVLSSDPCRLMGCQYELVTELTPVQEKVYEHVLGLHTQSPDTATIREIMDAIGRSKQTISKAVHELAELGLLEATEGQKPPLRYRQPMNACSQPLYRSILYSGCQPSRIGSEAGNGDFTPDSPPQITQLNAETGRLVATGTNDARPPPDDYEPPETEDAFAVSEVMT